MPIKKNVDWEGVEKEFRLGQLSLREIGARFGITEAAVRKKAKALNWERDLAEKIAKKADVILQREVLKDKPNASENELVQANALLAADVVRSHRLLATKSREQGEILLRELEENRDGDNLFARARIFQSLSGSLKTVVEMERLAFGLDKAADAEQAQQGIQISFVQPAAGNK